jgi:hypothetical protein
MGETPAAIGSCLGRLAPHLRLADVALTGSVAIGRERAGDLDLVAGSIDVVAPSATTDFLVSHYHVQGPGVPKFMVQLVDSLTRVRVDIVPDLTGSIARAGTTAISGISVKVLSLDDILDHKLHTLSKASPMRPVDPKHVRDARTIALRIGCTIPDIDPRSLVPDVYGVDEPDEGCARCQTSRSRLFPLAPKSRVFELLGWPKALA